MRSGQRPHSDPWLKCDRAMQVHRDLLEPVDQAGERGSTVTLRPGDRAVGCPDVIAVSGEPSAIGRLIGAATSSSIVNLLRSLTPMRAKC